MTNDALRTGFDLKTCPGSLRLALVNADVDTTSKVLADLLQTTRRENVDAIMAHRGRINVFQYKEQAWTGLVPLMVPYDEAFSSESAAALSKALDADVLDLEFQDTAGWWVYRHYRGGGVVEEFQWGVDYLEEMEEMGVDVSKMNEGWDLSVTGGDELDPDRFQFRSTLRTVDETQICEGVAFLDATYRKLGAWQPSLDALYSAGPEDLVRADLIDAAD